MGHNVFVIDRGRVSEVVCGGSDELGHAKNETGLFETALDDETPMVEE